MFKKEDITCMLCEFDGVTGYDTSNIHVRVEKEIDGGVIVCYRCNRLNGHQLSSYLPKQQGVPKWHRSTRVRALRAQQRDGDINEDNLHDEWFIGMVYGLGSVNVEAELSDETVAEF